MLGSDPPAEGRGSVKGMMNMPHDARGEGHVQELFHEEAQQVRGSQLPLQPSCTSPEVSAVGFSSSEICTCPLSPLETQCSHP